MIRLSQLTLIRGVKPLIEAADLTLNPGEKVGLIGANGSGKSSLFALLRNELHADAGDVDFPAAWRIAHVAQETPALDRSALDYAIDGDTTLRRLEAELAVAEAAHDGLRIGELHGALQDADAYTVRARAEQLLTGLGFTNNQMRQPLASFSGGWRMRLNLAQALMCPSDLLLLDEPTNHLDLLTLIWFQRYLSNYPGAILLISHDRDFMDAIIENVVEIDPDAAELIAYTGNYSAYLEQREARYEQKVQAYRNQRKEIEGHQEFIDRFRQVGSKAAQVQSRIKLVEKLDIIEKPRAPRKPFKFAFPQPARSNQKVVDLQKVDFSYGNEKVIYKGLDLTIERGDKIVLVGPNGAGKSTLLKMLSGQLEVTGGTREVGYLTKMGYYSQHRSETLNVDNTVLEEVLASCDTLREEDARAILGTFLFRRSDVEKRCGILSGGEKSRLNLVKFLVDPPNLLLMDEPTTHLDILSIDSLVNALKSYEGTLVFISHDVHFIRNLAETTLHIARSADDTHAVLTRYTGGYDYFIEKSGLDDDRSAVTA